jgi:hypothetical protein
MFKKSKSWYYLQLVDSLGFIYHVGPVNLENLAACAYAVGADEKDNQRRRIMKRLANIGFENLEEAASVYWQAYSNGIYGLVSKIDNVDMAMYDEKNTRVWNRQKVNKMLYRRCMEKFETFTHEQIRKWVQDKVRNATEKEYNQLVEDEAREFNEGIINMLREKA